MLAKVLDFVVSLTRGIYIVPERYEVLRCIKSLHKSTYKHAAFKKGHTYVVAQSPFKSTSLKFVIDETGHPFNFKTKSDETPITQYLFSDYFTAK